MGGEPIWGALKRAMVSFVIAFSFCDWLLSGKIMSVGGSMCIENRVRLCELSCFQMTTNWFGVGGKKVIFGRASSISP